MRCEQGARSPRAVELVGRDAQQVEPVAREVDGEVSRGLDGVCVEEDAPLAAGATEVMDVLHAAYLVVCVHHGDEAGILAQGFLNGLHAHDALGVRLHECHLEVAAKGAVRRGEPLEHAQDARVLYSRRHDVTPALARSIRGTREQGLVVGLRTTRGKLDLSRAGVQAGGDASPGTLERPERGIPSGVLAAGVGEGIPLVDGAHGVERGGGDARGGCVVEVYKLGHGLVPVSQ